MSNSSVNVGSQKITWRYRQDASSSEFNRLYSDIVPVGIYAGGKLERLSDTVISVKKMVVLIRSNEREHDKISLRIETTTDQDVSLGARSCDPSNNYIVARFGWEDVENNFMEFLAVKYSNNPNEYRPNYIQPTDIVLGKVLFEESGGNWIVRETHAFDYTRRQAVYSTLAQDVYGEYRVLTCEEDPTKIHVTGGNSYSSKGFVRTVGGNFPESGFIPHTGAKGRHDIVFINADGEVCIELGKPSVSPETPLYGNRKVIAEIRRGPNRNDIIGDDIVWVNLFGQTGTIEAGGFMLSDENNYFTEKNVESALKQTWEKAVVLQDLLAKLTLFAKETRDDLNSHAAFSVDEGIVHGIERVTYIEPLVLGEEVVPAVN